jgi:isopentenyl phosphate kinase
MNELVFLKLGGSLITTKTQRYAARIDRLLDLALELRATLANATRIQLVLGHGSGSFGHFAYHEHLDASRYPPSQHARPKSDITYWNGVTEVWYRASQLNRYVMDALHDAGVSAIALAPSACATSRGGELAAWEIGPLRAALEAGVIPVIFGDIVLDPVLGAKVLSTEVLMWHLAQQLKPARILLAGMEQAVWADFPNRSAPIRRITPGSFAEVADRVGGSQGRDVTGGMRSKVEEMLALVQAVPGIKVQIFSGEIPGNLGRALAGEELGTIVTSD